MLNDEGGIGEIHFITSTKIKDQRQVRIDTVDPLDADAIFLLHEAAREIRPLYGSPVDEAHLPANDTAVPRSVYLIARIAENPVGSIALRPYEETVGEVCRMYVLPDFRRHKIARLLLAQIEAFALEFGYKILRLETGNRQLAAIALYEFAGYQHIPAFGKYIDDSTSVCFEKMIAPE